MIEMRDQNAELRRLLSESMMREVDANMRADVLSKRLNKAQQRVESAKKENSPLVEPVPELVPLPEVLCVMLRPGFLQRSPTQALI